MIALLTFITYIVGIACVLTVAYNDYIEPKVAIILAIFWPVLALYTVGHRVFA